jgi:chromate transporter
VAFGGGNTAIRLLEAEAVPQWLTRQDFGELVGINFAFPGVSIVKLAGMVGLKAAGGWGLLAAVVGLVTPGLVLTISAYGVLLRYRDHPLVQRGLLAMQYAAVALLISSAINIFQTTSGVKIQWITIAFTAALFAAVQFLKVSPVLVMVAAVVTGVWLV